MTDLNDTQLLFEDLGLPWPEARRILIVDDEPDNLFVLEAILEEQYHVITADSGPAALEALARHGEVDLVISDQRMPGMTGVELLTRVARAMPEVVRMVLTGYSDVEPIVSAINRGSVYRFLLKPWDADELLAAVDDALATKAQKTMLDRAVSYLALQRFELQETLRDLEATQKQLVAAQRLSTLGQLTSGLSHDINNQLSTMVFVLDELSMGSTDARVMESADSAYKTLQGLLHLLRDVKAFSRSQTIDLAREPLATRQLIADTLALLDLEKGAGGVARTVTITPESELMHVDASRVRQALMALVRNAILAGGQGPVTIRSAVRSGEAVLEVVDDGCGMDATTVQRAVEPFFSGFDPPGLGLGLGIADHVARAHGGHLELQSTAGLGTTARLRLGRHSVEPG